MIKHKVIIEKDSVLVIEKDPKWKNPTIRVSVLFDSDPKEVLKYGPNGLHLTEHLMWKIINSKYPLLHSNASTFCTGEMCIYGIIPEIDAEKGLRGFYEGLSTVVTAKSTPFIKQIHTNEQRRVTAETHSLIVRSNSSPVDSMFTYNTDLIRSEFPIEYIWKIIREEIELRKIVVVAHCKVDDKLIDAFHECASTFYDTWKNRSYDKEVRLPLFYPPSISWFTTKKHELFKPIKLDHIDNPIIKILVAERISHGSPYYIKIVPEKIACKHNPFYTINFTDQYFIARIIESSGKSIKTEWIDDLHNLSQKELYEKYKKDAEKYIAEYKIQQGTELQ